jgi:hypothetical protein
MKAMRFGWIRSALVLTITLAAGCAHAPPSRPDDARALIERAIAASGGADALAAATVLTWRGQASVFLPDRTIELTVDTEVVPFRWARSRTQRPGVAGDEPRTLIVAGDTGYAIRGERSTPLPEQQLRHERQQYAVYGLLRWLPLRDAESRIARLPDDADGHPGVHAEVPGAPAADIYFDHAGHPLYLLDTVDAPEGDGRIAQRFEFEGEVIDQGVRWPRVLRILQEGKPYFELRIERFAVKRHAEQRIDVTVD